ncbi:MAG: methylated-DNA--[protein]-cysteine S-methyltransferase [Bacteroidetes bacterium]|nr:methylated-DNA--[protein]-cysteine S-methyltransferase [Bacteroidota bacterium]
MSDPSLYTTYYESQLGVLEIQYDDEGVHAILFANAFKGPKPDPGQIIITSPENQTIKTCIAQLREYFEGKRKNFDFSFSQKGTDFQLNVWNALLDIPYGKTISYMELSKRIGNAKAIRAVGTTNGKNRLSIVVPCHRVIGTNGNLIGYGGELWRKKWLLEHEAKYANGIQTLGGW